MLKANNFVSNHVAGDIVVVNPDPIVTEKPNDSDSDKGLRR